MSERTPTPIAVMEEQAALEMAKNEAQRRLEHDQANAAAIAENNQRDHDAAIEARKTTPEVSALNDKAEFEIFGSRGRTYTDPETGAVLATPDKPTKGVIEEMRSNPRWGKTQAERDAAADMYAGDIEALLSQGFELCQAKLVQDLRYSHLETKSGVDIHGDAEGLGKLAGKYISEGMDSAEAKDKAVDFYNKKDEARKKLIKEGGAFTLDDYKRLRKGEVLYGPDSEPEPVPVEPKVPEIVRTEELDRLEKVLASTRRDVARMRAGRERKSFMTSKYSKEELEATYDAYEQAKTAAGVEAVRILREAGFSEEEIVSAVNWGSALESKELTVEQYRIESAEIDSKRLKKFYRWWEKQGNKLLSWGTVKKGAVMGLVGVPLAVGSAIIAAPILAGTVGAGAGVAAGLAAARAITRGTVGNKIRQNSRAAHTAHDKAIDRHNRKMTLITEAETEGRILDEGQLRSVDMDDTREVFKGNVKRAVASAAIAGAVGGALAFGISEVVHGGGDHPKGGRPDVGGGNPEEVPPAPGPGEVPPVEIPTDLPAGDSRFPWTVWTERMGTNGTPKIEELVAKAHDMNIEFVGNGQGGGVGAITEVRLPGGQVYTDLGRINAYLEYVNNASTS